MSYYSRQCSHRLKHMYLCFDVTDLDVESVELSCFVAVHLLLAVVANWHIQLKQYLLCLEWLRQLLVVVVLLLVVADSKTFQL